MISRRALLATPLVAATPQHEAALDGLKKRCERFKALGLTPIDAPTATAGCCHFWRG